MLITTTFIVAEPNNTDRFVKIYHTVDGRYFYQMPQGAIKEITKEQFLEYSSKK